MLVHIDKITGDSPEKAMFENTMRKIILSNYGILDSIIVYFNNGKLNLIYAPYAYETLQFDLPALIEKYQLIRERYNWVNLRENDFFNRLYKEEENNIVSIIKLFGTEKTTLHGVVVFNLRERFFRQILQKPDILEHEYFAIISSEGQMIFNNINETYALDATIYERLLMENQKEGVLKIKNSSGMKMGIVYTSILPYNWKLIAVFPEKESFVNIISFIKSNISITLIIFVITIFFLYFLLSRTITKPIMTLVQKINRTKNGDLSVLFDVQSSNEIGVLNEGLKVSFQKIKQLLKDLEEHKEKEKQVELDLLLSQIKPHFLYNTLQSATQLCDFNNAADAGTMLSALGQYCRISLSGGKRVITIEEDIKHIKSYLIIQQMRYRDVFTYDFSIAHEIRQVTLPKFTLQPLIENAIYHGVKMTRKTGLISVLGWLENGDVFLEISDDGIGISFDRLTQIQQDLEKGTNIKSLNLGLINVHTRLRLRYGDPYGITIDSKKGEGTSVKIRIPADSEEEQKE